MARDRTAWLRGELSGWVSDGIVDEATADAIRARYPATSEADARKALNAVFAVIGLGLVFLGAIVLAAFNWEDIPRGTRVALAFAPLVASYALALFAFLRRDDRPAWRESACVAAILGFAACAGLLSQIYQISGEARDLFLLSAVFALPFVYVLRSNAGTLVYLCALTAWTSMSQWDGGESLWYWPLFAAVVPRLVAHAKKDRYGSTTAYLGWITTLSLYLGLGVSLEKTLPGLWIVAYALLFACLRLAGALAYEDAPSRGVDPLGSTGFLGSYTLAFMLTYTWPWREIGWNHYRGSSGGFFAAAEAVDYLVTAGLLACFVALVVVTIRRRRLAPLTEGAFAAAVLVCYLVASASGVITRFSYRDPTGAEFRLLLVIHLIMNACILGAGVFHILRGYASNRLGTVNFGTLVLCVLICLRFVFVEGFFENMIARGLAFMGLGFAFLLVNFALSRKLSKGESR